jgi:hypothetical protein
MVFSSFRSRLALSMLRTVPGRGSSFSSLRLCALARVLPGSFAHADATTRTAHPNRIQIHPVNPVHPVSCLSLGPSPFSLLQRRAMRENNHVSRSPRAAAAPPPQNRLPFTLLRRTVLTVRMKLSVVIPCYNEAKTIRTSPRALTTDCTDFTDRIQDARSGIYPC